MKYLIKPNPHKAPSVPIRRLEKSPNGQTAEINDRSFSRAPDTQDTWMVGLSSITGRLKTGLNDMVDNPHKNESNFRNKAWEDLFKGKDKVLRQHLLEYKHGHDAPGFYTDTFVKPEVTRDPAKLGFFQREESAIELNDGVTVLDDTNPLDEVKVHAVKANTQQFATSVTTLQGQSYYIVAEQDDGKEKVQLKQLKNEAIAKLTELSNTGEQVLIEFFKALFLGKAENHMLRNLSKAQVYEQLDNYLNTTSGVKEQIEAFNEIYSLSKNDPTTFNARVLLFDAISYRVIVKVQNAYNWTPPKAEGIQQETLKWNRIDEVLYFLADPAREPEQSLIEKQIKSKKES